MITFADKLSVWCGPDGWPLSWRHYVYGMTYLGRDHMRTQLLIAQATRIASTTKDDYVAWSRDLTKFTGVPRDG